MSPSIPYRNLPLALLEAREIVLGHFRPILTHFGLTEQQWRIIRTLDERGEVEQRELSEICRILSPSLTGILSRMEEIGLVGRTRMAEDHRRILVRLTDKSRAVIEAMRPLIIEQYGMMEAAYGADVVAALYQVTDRLRRLSATPVATVRLPGDATETSAERPIETPTDPS